MAEQTVESKATPEQQEKAGRLGWVPPDKFRGDASKYVDADAFLDRAEHVMPILKQNNDRLQEQIGGLTGEVSKLKELLAASQDSIKALNEFYTEETKRQAASARSKLLAELKAAKTAGDVDSEVEITDELAQLNAAETQAKNAPKEAKPAANATPPQTPEFKAWNAENKWFGADKRRTALAVAIAEELRDKGDTRVNRAFLDEVSAEVERIVGVDNRGGSDKVEGGRGNARRVSGGHTFADLPQDAKDACHRDAKRLVGPGRAFKTMTDWEKRYVEVYDWS